jgi:type IV pilus assembly protein PilC
MNYFYEATDPSGQTILGKIDAASEAEAHVRLQEQGFQVQALALHPAANTGESAALPVPAVPEAAPMGRVQRTPVAGDAIAIGQSAAQTTGPVQTPPRTAPRTGGIILAGNAAQVAARNRLAPLQTRRTNLPVPVAPTAPAASTLGGVSTRDLLLYFQQLASLVKSGMTVYTSLDNLAARTANRNLARVTHEMAEQARTGGSVSDVMARYPRIFPDDIVGLFRAGELGGYLDIAIAEAADSYEQNIALYRTSWLPKALATQAFFMFALAQPLFPTLFPNADVALYLKLVFLRNLPLTLLLYLLIRQGARLLQLPQHRYRRDAWSLRFPPFGELQRQIALKRFIRTLGRLYQAGLPPAQAWEGAMNTASNRVIRERLVQAHALMEQGAPLPEAFAVTGLFANSVEQLIATGQQSGEVVEMLDRAGNYYQEQADQAASKAKFMMLRLGIIAMLLLGGGTLIWMAKTYFKSIFDFASSFEQ